MLRDVRGLRLFEETALGELMRLLDEIVSDATSDEVRLSVLLRKAMVLASRLRNNALKDWVHQELDGYKVIENIPPYRIVPVTAKGDLFSPFAQVTNHILPPSSMEPAHRHYALVTNLSQGIAAYDQIKYDSVAIIVEWPADLIAVYRNKVLNGPQLFRAWQEIPPSAIMELLDTVRTRLLTFALELQEELGEVEDAELKDVAPAVVDRVVNQYIYGNYVAAERITGGVHQTGTKIVVKGDLNSLVEGLEEAGVSEPDIEQLKTAIDDDAAAGTSGLGEKVSFWLAERAQSLGDNVFGATVGAMVLRYYGLA